MHKSGKPALSAVSCAFPAGQLTTVIGPNGAGKSTLLRTIAGLETVSRGSIAVGEPGGDAPGPGAAVPRPGRAPRELVSLAPIERAKLTAWVPDHGDMPFAFTVRDVVLMGRFPWHQGAPTRADRDRAEAAIADLEITALAERPLGALSSGERQKAHVARALASDAPCLLFDEPTANLDIGAALHLLARLAALAKAGKTVVITVHDLALAHRFAGAAVCLSQGAVLAAGAPAAVFAPAVLHAAFGVRAEAARTASGREVLRFEP